MGIRVGPWDPLQLSFQIINVLLKSGKLTVAEAKEILRNTLPKEMSDEEKNVIIDSMITTTP